MWMTYMCVYKYLYMIKDGIKMLSNIIKKNRPQYALSGNNKKLIVAELWFGDSSLIFILWLTFPTLKHTIQLKRKKNTQMKLLVTERPILPSGYIFRTLRLSSQGGQNERVFIWHVQIKLMVSILLCLMYNRQKRF